MNRAAASRVYGLATVMVLVAGAGPSCQSHAPSEAKGERGRVAAPGARGAADGSAAPPGPASGAAAPMDAEPEPACPPDVADGTVPVSDGDDAVLPRTVALVAPREPRTVVVQGKGVTMTFGLEEFTVTARCLRMKLVTDFLAARPANEGVVTVSDAAAPSISSQAQFVVAALLDRSHARVHEGASNRDVASIVRDRWSWMGCGGKCRQQGREYRLRVPGEIFYRTTDRFADGLWTPPRTDGPSPGPSGRTGGMYTVPSEFTAARIYAQPSAGSTFPSTRLDDLVLLPVLS